MTEQVRTFPSTPETTSAALDFIEELVDAWALPENVREAAVMVAGEAVPNAAGHGNGFDPDREVILYCRKGEGEFRMCVEDEGPGLTDALVETSDLPADDLQTHGRGLFIIRSLADRVWLEAAGRRLCVAWTIDPSERV
jgi:serine/threonine-protein kinase RsbW